MLSYSFSKLCAGRMRPGHHPASCFLILCLVFLRSLAEEPRACLSPETSEPVSDRLASGNCLDAKYAKHHVGIGILRGWLQQAPLKACVLEIHHIDLRLSPPPFVYASRLAQLQLHNVDLSSIGVNSFLGLTSVHTLEVVGSIPHTLPSRLLSPVRRLRHLTLSSASPVHLDQSFFSGNAFLRTVFLNLPEQPTVFQLPWIHYLVASPLSHPVDDSVEPAAVAAQVVAHTVNCSCATLLQLRALLHNSEPGLSSALNLQSLRHATCATPAALRGQRLVSLPVNDMCQDGDHGTGPVTASPDTRQSPGKASPRHIRSIQLAVRKLADQLMHHRSMRGTAKNLTAGHAAAIAGVLVFVGLTFAFLCCKNDRKSPKASGSLADRVSQSISKHVVPLSPPEDHVKLFVQDPELTPEELEEQQRLEEERQRAEEERLRLEEEERLWQEEEERKRLAEEERWRKIKEEREAEALKEQEQQDLAKGLRRALTVRRTVLRDAPASRQSSSDSDSWSSSSNSGTDSEASSQDCSDGPERKKKTKKKKKAKKKKKTEKLDEKKRRVSIDDATTVVVPQRTVLGNVDPLESVPEGDHIPMGIVERMAQTLAKQNAAGGATSDSDGGENRNADNGDEPSGLITPTGSQSSLENATDDGSPAKNETGVELVKEEVLRMLMGLMGGKGMYGEGNMATEDDDNCMFDSDEFDSISEEDEDEDEDAASGAGDASLCAASASGVDNQIAHRVTVSDSQNSLLSGSFEQPDPPEGSGIGNIPSIGNFAVKAMFRKSSSVRSKSSGTTDLAVAALDQLTDGDIYAWTKMSEDEKQHFLTTTLKAMKAAAKSKPKKAGQKLKKMGRAVSVRHRRHAKAVKEVSITENDLKEWEDGTGPAMENCVVIRRSITSQSSQLAMIVSDVDEEVGGEARSRRGSYCGQVPTCMIDMDDGSLVPEVPNDFLDTVSVNSADKSEKRMSVVSVAADVVRRCSIRKRGNSLTTQTLGNSQEPTAAQAGELKEVDDWEMAKIGKNW